MNIEKIFERPNTPENEAKREEIIAIYKGIMGVPQCKGVNVCDVIKWASTFVVFNDESENEDMNNVLTCTEEEFSADGFYLSYRVGDMTNTMILNGDADIWELGLAIKNFVAGCGYSEKLINQIMKE